ncbi:hypothetical protein [Halalkalirubrum salinum]|nr:hypothetical protein [Halalkalirubrum salinum]
MIWNFEIRVLNDRFEKLETAIDRDPTPDVGGSLCPVFFPVS